MGLKKRDNKCVRVCGRGWFFVTLQEYIFTSLNHHQRAEGISVFQFFYILILIRQSF